MQPSSELRLHSIDLSEFGLTSSGASEYRVVWADSRRIVAFRGEEKLSTPKYQYGAESELQGKWILERWLPAERYYGMTAEQWEKMQRTALDKPKLTRAQDREIDRYLSTLSREMRSHMEKMLTPPEQIPVIEPYSHDGEYEFAGLYFSKTVDEAYLKQQIRRHIYRLNHMNTTDRRAEMEAADQRKDAENDQKFEGIWNEAREESLMQV